MYDSINLHRECIKQLESWWDDVDKSQIGEHKMKISILLSLIEEEKKEKARDKRLKNHKSSLLNLPKNFDWYKGKTWFNCLAYWPFDDKWWVKNEDITEEMEEREVQLWFDNYINNEW